MASFPSSDTDSDASKLAALWEAWNAALKASDANGLVALMTDDVVFVRATVNAYVAKKNFSQTSQTIWDDLTLIGDIYLPRRLLLANGQLKSANWKLR